MSTEIAIYQNSSLDERYRYAKAIAAGGELLPKGLWANVKNPETGLMENRPSPGKVMLITETGLMLGLHPMAALRGIDVIEGNPTLKPALMSALIRDAGHTLRIQQTGSVDGGDLAVTVTGIRSDDPDFPYTYTWTPHDALRAGLLDSYAPNDKGVWVAKARDDKNRPKPWEKWTARMCRWRAVGDVGSAGFEDVLMGLHFTPEEFGADVNDAGELIPSTDTAAPPAEQPNWAAQLKASITVDGLKDLWATVPEAAQTDALRAVMLARGGELRRAERAADPESAGQPAPGAPRESPAEPEPIEPSHTDPEVIEAELVDDAPAGSDDYETEAQRIERERIDAEEFARWKATQGGAA